jgi:hypothetical protein
MWYYRIIFASGEIRYRKNVTKKLAQSVELVMREEMLLFGVVSVECGEMK